MYREFVTGFIVWYIVYLFSTTLHEAMHSLVSQWGGDATASGSGQATLNPAPHIRRSPMGMVIVPILTFIMSEGKYLVGWASAPYNPYWAARYPKRAFLMALAGPLSHLPLTLLSFAAMFVGLRTGFFLPEFTDAMFPVTGRPDDSLAWALALFCGVSFRLNTLLLVFNLLPLPPLDGSEVWFLFIKREEDRLRLRFQSSAYYLAGLALAWYIFPHVYYPVMGVLIRLLFLL